MSLTFAINKPDSVIVRAVSHRLDVQTVKAARISLSETMCSDVSNVNVKLAHPTIIFAIKSLENAAVWII